MEEGQPGSPKGSNRTGNPAIGTLSWQSFQERDPTGYRKLVTSVMRDDFTIQSMPTMSKYSLFCWVAAQMAQLFGFYLVMRVHFIAKKKDSQVEKIAKPILELLVWVIGLTLYCLPAALHVAGIF